MPRTISFAARCWYAESSVIFNEQIKPPFMNEYAISLSQRVKGITPYMEVIDTEVCDETFQEFNIVSISQTTTTLTVVLDNPFDGGLGYLVDIWGPLIIDLTMLIYKLLVYLLIKKH